jgi:hypothetical protein
MKHTEAFDDGVPPAEAEYLHNPEVAHEHGDINVRAVIAFLLGLAAVMVVSMGLMWVLFKGLNRVAASNDPDISPVAIPAGQLPPAPRLLTNEPAELQKRREAEAEVLAGGTDEKTGAARPSIDEAKKRLLEQGLPVRAGEPVDPRLGTHAPAFGESSGGRVLGSERTGTQPAASQPAAPARPPAAAQPHGGGH